ncbi:MAG: PucR family transcriptional regulator [Mycobacterium sp.]
MEGERPTNQVRELFRHGAQIVLNAQSEWLEAMHDAELSAPNMQELAVDPVLNAALRRTTRANLLHWAAANVRDPGAPVPANVGPETLGIARDLVRRGLNESALQAYRVGQNVAWQRWMSIAFTLASDPDELRELLDVSARSLFTFVDETLAGVAEQMRIERDELTRGTHAERLETVALILDGAPISRQRAEARLGYNLEQTHTAAVVWSDDPESSQLERATEALVRTADAHHPLSVIASAATRWVWIPGKAAPDLRRLEEVTDQMSGVRIAVGSTARGIEGFRRSHLDAITTQRMLTRLNSTQRIASFETVQLVSLVTQDPDRADQFIKQTLGELESASPELRAAVLTFINEQCNASRAAARLYTHRNTLLRRLSRVEQLLPRPLDENSVHVAVALEMVHWRGSVA